MYKMPIANKALKKANLGQRNNRQNKAKIASIITLAGGKMRAVINLVSSNIVFFSIKSAVIIPEN